MCFEKIDGLFKEISKLFQTNFRGVSNEFKCISKKTEVCSKRALRLFYCSLEVIPKNLKECFKDMPCFKEVLKVLQESFEEFLKKF